MGHGAGKFVKKAWATVDPVAGKALGVDVSWKREALVNPINAGLRAASDDRIDLTSRESTEGAATGAAVGGSAGGPIGAIAGAIGGGLVGSVQHYQNVKEGVAKQGIFGMKAIDEETVGGGKAEKLGSGITIGSSSSGGGSSKGAEVTQGEAVGLGDNSVVEDATAQKNRMAQRGKFAGMGEKTFGFTQSERLGA